MDIKSYFTGPKGRVIWINIGLMILVLILAPLATLFYLDYYTGHGERVEVPSVEGQTVDDAQGFLAECGLIGEVSDSVNMKAGFKRGTIFMQTPKAGSSVKNGRKVYLTVVRTTDVLIKFPDVIGNGTVEEARQTLRNLGFSFTEDKEVENEDMKGFVINVYQGGRKLFPGQQVSTDAPLTLYVGKGADKDTLNIDDLLSDDIE